MGFTLSSIGCLVCVASLYIHTTTVSRDVPVIGTAIGISYVVVWSGVLEELPWQGTVTSLRRSDGAGSGGADALQARSLPTPGVTGLHGEEAGTLQATERIKR